MNVHIKFTAKQSIIC